MNERYDIVVVGGGHAGSEAALICARMGLRTLLLTLSVDAIGFMPCNPSIGGTSKGNLVREVDALGGQMGISADATRLQIKMLNTGKGPAVHCLRAQSDKLAYQLHMRRTVENTENLTVKQGEAVRVHTENGCVRAVETAQGDRYDCTAAVLAAGVYLRSRIITGEYVRECGPNGFLRSETLSRQLHEELWLPLQRFKTGTPARIDGRTVDWSVLEPQYGDPALSFSFLTDEPSRENQPCYLAYTNERTHAIIRANLHRAPMFTGSIHGTGARYCPSIEDKVVRFAEKDRHQLFLEPEGAYTREIYLQGLSTSLPADVQTEMIHTIAGLEHAHVVRAGYAIEYDCLDPLCLNSALAVKSVRGLYCAGQINGTSGYEEAAAQGIYAGINAAHFVQGKPAFVLSRSEAYIGVLVDDLVTKGTSEPYRMMTSRAEFRLSLRQDNADLRLTPKGFEAGSVSPERMARCRQRAERIALARQALETLHPGLAKTGEILAACGEEPSDRGLSYPELLKRANVTYEALCRADSRLPALPPADALTLQADCKYEGYLKKQQAQIDELRRLESRPLPPDLDYSAIKGLRIEGAQKLNALKPTSVGQASRISGVSPADIAVLLVYLSKEGGRHV